MFPEPKRRTRLVVRERPLIAANECVAVAGQQRLGMQSRLSDDAAGKPLAPVGPERAQHLARYRCRSRCWPGEG
jgi:hypothetical protein